LNQALAQTERFTDAECRAALASVLASSHFRRSFRLRKFLSYVVKRSLEEEDIHLTEQQVGIALFERRPGYDTTADNIVRVNASEMRKRLELYYAEEGADDPVIIEIPRGAYQPAFLHRPERREPLVTPELPNPISAPLDTEYVSDTSVSQRETVATAPSRRARIRNWKTGTLSTLLLGALAVAAVQTYRVHVFEQQVEPWRTGSSLQAFWSNFFDSNLDTVVVLADTSFAMAQDLSGYQLTLNDYLRQTYQNDPDKLGTSEMDQKSARTVLSLVSNRNSGSMSDFRTALRVASLRPTSPSVQIRFAKDFTGESLRHDSVVLIGSSRSNPWVEPFQQKLYYRMESSASPATIQVELLDPGRGEQKIYATSPDPNRTDGFCVIAYLPSLSGEGKTLIISGTDSQATEAGGDFMTQESSLEDLQQRLGGDLKTGSFQLLLRTSRAVGSPLNTEIVSVRRGSL
jgi:hypothetical protein